MIGMPARRPQVQPENAASRRILQLRRQVWVGERTCAIRKTEMPGMPCSISMPGPPGRKLARNGLLPPGGFEARPQTENGQMFVKSQALLIGARTWVSIDMSRWRRCIVLTGVLRSGPPGRCRGAARIVNDGTGYQSAQKDRGICSARCG